MKMKINNGLKEAFIYKTPQYTLVVTCPDDLLEESVIYQDILQKGEQRGEQRGVKRGVQIGAQQEGKTIALRLLERRYGKLTPQVRQRVERLAREQFEALCEALLDFQSKQDLTRWLKQHVPAR